ncbi:MAG: hypothetical protein IKA79_03080, partial [Lentisphaeria bacterium]|nr:hypothetical protein [Lentisphaeria bacterium]
MEINTVRNFDFESVIAENITEEKMIRLSENEIQEIFEKANRTLPEELLEFSMILSGKCKIGPYRFPAPSLGTYILLEEWKSPFIRRREEDKDKRVKILLKDLYLALFLLENGRRGAEYLMEQRMKNFFRKRKDTDRLSLPLYEWRMLEKKYCRLDPPEAVFQLQQILSLHSAVDMLPDENNSKTGDFSLRKREKISYCTWMENLTGILYFVQADIPSLTPGKILWELPYALLGFLLIYEARKNHVEGIGREKTSRLIWELFSRKMKERKAETLNKG